MVPQKTRPRVSAKTSLKRDSRSAGISSTTMRSIFPSRMTAIVPRSMKASIEPSA